MSLGRISRIRCASIAKIAKAVKACVESLEDRVFFSGTILRPDHIVVVVNQDRFSEALVSPSMPYTQSIAASGLVYTDSHGVTHPSEPNLLALYSGSTQGVTTNDQGYSFPTQNNIAKELFDAGYTFSGAAESMPSDGSQANWLNTGTWPDLYVRYLNPMAMFGNVGIDPATGQPRANAVVNRTFQWFSAIPTNDYSSLPTVTYVIPNNMHSTHGSNEAYPWAGSPDDENNELLRTQADSWMHDNLDGYLQWAKTHNSLLIITQDEEHYTGGTWPTVTTILNGDNHLFVPGTDSETINHYNLLRTITDMYGLAPLANSAGVSRFNTDAQGRLSGSLATGTSTSLTSSGTSVFGQTVTLTASVVSSTTGVPTGTVTFKDGSTAIGIGSLNASGVATLTTSSLSVATHSITASYSGDATFATSASAALSQAVNRAPTTTNLGTSVNPSTFGQSVTFTATVVGYIPGTGSGTVTFMDGANVLGTVSHDANGVATLSTSALGGGAHSITATYNGSSNFVGSTSSTVTQNVSTAGTTTTLGTSANPSNWNQSVTFTATVNDGGLPGVPTGIVSFMDGLNVLGTGTLNASGIATLTTSALIVGDHTITAVYAGSANFTTSTSSPLTQSINKATTTTSLTSSAPGALPGQNVTFTATVSGAPAGTPDGTVTFMDGADVLSIGTLNASGVATFATSGLALGNHTITAVYAGSTNFVTSTSSSLTQSVNKATTTTSLTSSAPAALPGQSVTFTATVSGAPAGVPSGTVTFMDGANVLGAGTLDASGVATLSTSALSIGSHPITVTYDGDASFIGSSSNTVNQLVNSLPATTTSVSSSVNPSTFGQSVTFTAAVSSGSGTPTGTVQFVIDGTNFGSPVTLVNGSATSQVITSLAIGPRTITAVYSGSAGFNGSTSADFTQNVIAGVPNDAFANRVTIGGTSASVTGTNVGATKEAGEPNHAGKAGGKSVWWTWTPSATGSVTIDTIGSNFDTLLAVYTGSAVNALTSVASNNDASGIAPQSKLTFTATAGKVYQIAVDGNNAAAGNIKLNLVQTVPPPAAPTNIAATDGTYSDKVRVTWTASAAAIGYEVWRNTTNSSGTATKITASDVTGGTTLYDDTTAVVGTTYWYWVKANNANGTSGFSGSNSGYRIAPNNAFANRIALTGTNITTTSSNVGASKETGEPRHAGNSGGKSLWWTWTATTSGTVTLDTAGSSFDTLLAVYTGSAVNGLTAVASNDDAAGGGTLTSKVVFNVTAGKTYQIAVDGYNGASGNITLHLKQA